MPRPWTSKVLLLTAILATCLPGCTASRAPATADGNISPDLLCVAPVPPSTNQDSLAVSSYQAERQRFMDCVAKSGANGHQPDQQQLDQSLAAIGDDQLDAVDQSQQDVRGAVDKLGGEGARR